MRSFFAMYPRILICAAGLAAAQPAIASDYQSALRAFLDGEIAAWADSEAIVSAIRAQNDLTNGYDQARINVLDTAWQEEVGAADTPTISPVLNGATSDFLRARVAESGGRITEVIVMDARGLNVAVSDVTSDYWQGDEDKFTQTFGAGPDAVHFSEVELDESTQRYQAQISITIIDPATGQSIGAMTVGVDADSLL
jgi:hypothetical protein